VNKALENNSWITKIDLDQGFEVEHIQQFVTLWKVIFNVQLPEGVKYAII
jgi:hypothetical protein